MLCSRLRRSTYAQPGRGRERTAFASRVSTCKQNGLAHERLRYPKPSFCRRFGLPNLKNIVRRSVSYHRRRRSTATIKLTSCHVACGRRWASPWHAAQGLSSRVTNLCKASFGEWYSLLEHEFSSQDDFERGRRREMSSLKNEREQSLPRETARCSTTHHSRAPPICRVPSRLVFDSAILFLNSFSEKFCPISPHSLETDLYVRY